MEEGANGSAVIDWDDGIKILPRSVNGGGFALQHFADKLIRYKKQNQAKAAIKELLHNVGTFFHENTAAFFQIIRTLGGMPDLPSFHYINDVIVLTPHANLFIFQGAIVDSDQGIAAIELTIVIPGCFNLGIEVEQNANLRDKNRCTGYTMKYRKCSIF
jgi:hypothetical protein